MEKTRETLQILSSAIGPDKRREKGKGGRGTGWGGAEGKRVICWNKKRNESDDYQEEAWGKKFLYMYSYKFLDFSLFMDFSYIQIYICLDSFFYGFFLNIHQNFGVFLYIYIYIVYTYAIFLIFSVTYIHIYMSCLFLFCGNASYCAQEKTLQILSPME